jgi:hypothetical protein
MNDPVAGRRLVAAPALIVTAGASRTTLRPGTSCQLGRAPESGIVFTDSRVSWEHAVLQMDRGTWFVQDRGSTNGTFVDGRKIDRFELTGDCIVRLGNAADGPEVHCSLVRPVQPGPPPSPPPRQAQGASFQPPPAGASLGSSRVDVRPTAVIRAADAQGPDPAHRPRGRQRHRGDRPERLAPSRRAA